MSCNKIIKDYGWLGEISKRECMKPVYKDGLCKHHYDCRQAKSLNWIDRPTYRAATQHDLDSGRSLKLKNTNVHRIFMLRRGIIKVQKKGEWIETDYPVDFNLFCVLDY